MMRCVYTHPADTHAIKTHRLFYRFASFSTALCAIIYQSNKPTEKREAIKRMHVEAVGLFVSTLGPQPDKLITTQSITCCPIHSDLAAYTDVSANAETTDP